jgi:phospholipid/cholesterol/gamma-HCH transport system permease protein
MLVGFLQFVGKSVLNFYSDLFFRIKLFLVNLFVLFFPPFYLRRFFSELLTIGVASIPIVGMTAIFTGSVLALQSFIGFSRMDAGSSIPMVVVLSITRELGPVLTGLMLSGRVASNIASEVGSMKITDQLDAMYIMGIEKNHYILRPKLTAMLISMPILTLISDILGIFGGYLISITKLGYSPHSYEKMTFDFLNLNDVISGIIKASFFGVIIILIGYFSGLLAQKNTTGVGVSTRNAVVCSTILILIANYCLTYLLFS